MSNPSPAKRHRGHERSGTPIPEPTGSRSSHSHRQTQALELGNPHARAGHAPGDFLFSQNSNTIIPYDEQSAGTKNWKIPRNRIDNDRDVLKHLKNSIDKAGSLDSPVQEELFLRDVGISDSVLTKTYLHAWRRAHTALTELKMLRREARIYGPNDQITFFRFLKPSERDLEKYLYGLETLTDYASVTVSDDFKPITLLLAKVYDRIRYESDRVVDDVVHMGGLIRWFEDKRRIDYEYTPGTDLSLDILSYSIFTPDMLTELAVHGNQRNSKLREKYRRLAEEVRSYYPPGRIPMEVGSQIHDRPEDLKYVPRPDRDSEDPMYLFGRDARSIRDMDLTGNPELRTGWCKSIALLARQAQFVQKRHGYLEALRDKLESNRRYG